MGIAEIKARQLREIGDRPQEAFSAEFAAAQSNMASRGYELAGEVLRDVEEARCEGYANYATSSVAITLQNDRTMSNGLARLVDVAVKAAPAAEAVRDGTWSVQEATRFQLADYLKEYVETLMERGIKDGDVGLMASALVRAGFGEVDWEDLARVELARGES